MGTRDGGCGRSEFRESRRLENRQAGDGAHPSHVMLVGDGALKFAQAYGYHKEDMMTEKSRTAWPGVE